MKELDSNKSLNSLLWSIIQRFANLGIQFISGIILARLLTPSDYGIIGMLTIFMSIGYVFTDGGLGTAIIQKQKPNEKDFCTVYYCNIALSLIVYSIIYFSAPCISEFYREPVLTDILRIHCLILVINALYALQFNLLKKNFEFKRIAKVSLLSSLFTAIITITLAFKNFGVWALVVQNLLLSILPAVYYNVTTKWRPKLLFSFSSLKQLSSFSIFVLMTNLINNIANDIESLLIGKFYNASATGYYTKAKSTQGIATTSLSEALSQVTLPLYSNIQNDHSQLITTINRLSALITYITVPVVLTLIIVAKPLFLILYSDQWLNSVPYFQILCLSGIASSLGAINTHAVTAIGKSKQVMTLTLIKRVCGITIIFGGLLLAGINGLVIGVVIQNWISYLLNTFLVAKYLKYNLYTQFAPVIPVIIIGTVCFAFSNIIPLSSELNLYGEACIKVIVFVALFITTSLVFKPKAYTEFKQLCFNKLFK